ncbi:MAG: phosphoribosylanthranilate isomerase [Sneathiella sp.]
MTIATKICGLTCLEDALMAARAGADYLGFVLSDSPRQITPEVARAIIVRLPDSLKSVGVFVNEEPSRVNDLTEQCGLDYVQLQGQETPEQCSEYQAPVFKGLHMAGVPDTVMIHDYDVAALLFDAYVPGQAGGTGSRFDWQLLDQFEHRLPFFLAGGLTPSTVAEAISATQPFGVDVSSGVARSTRRKDASRVRQFIDAAHYHEKEKRYASSSL